MVHPWLLTSQNSPDPSWLESLGPFAAFGGLALLALGWLTRRLTEETKANRELSDRLVDTASQTSTILAATNRALDESTRAVVDATHTIEDLRRRSP